MSTTEEVGDHHGCPKCGSPEFRTSRDVTQFGSEAVYCTWISESEDEEPDFEDVDYGDWDSYDSESGDYQDEKDCQDCGHQYTEPTFYSQTSSVERMAEDSGLAQEEIESLKWLFETVPNARKIVVLVEPHATIVEAFPKEIHEGHRWSNYNWSVASCCSCASEVMDPKHRIRQVFRDDAGSGRRIKVCDRRLLPVLLRATLCAKCS